MSTHLFSPLPLARLAWLALCCCVGIAARAQTLHFDFTGKQLPAEARPIEGTQGAFCLHVPVQDGNYRVTVTLGSDKRAASTTVRAESRRLMLENVATSRRQKRTFTFVVNKRDTLIRDNEGNVIDRVRIKPRERAKLNWDGLLSLEVNGDAPACRAIDIAPADSVTTLWLCGNSTVVDQDFEPWASWGQMLPRWFGEGVAVANYAESGETASTFIAAGRLKKILSLARPGDYIFVEFGHNDQKQRFAGAGAWYNFSTCLKTFVDEARRRGIAPVFVTPTQRRSFGSDGKILETHGDYPDAMRAVARREQVPVIELHEMTRAFCESLGDSASRQAFVHYPAHTFPSQPQALADNTHFNPYGAYEIAKMVVEGMKAQQFPFLRHLRADYTPFSPAHPDPPAQFHWVNAPAFEALKPDGN